MMEKIKKLIDTYEEAGDFTYTSITDEQIVEAQSALGVKLPGQYLDFLRTYGHGGIGGIEVIGIGKNGKMLFVSETLKYREYGLDKNLVLIENCDEWVYCIDCNNHSIVSWSKDDIQNAYLDLIPTCWIDLLMPLRTSEHVSIRTLQRLADGMGMKLRLEFLPDVAGAALSEKLNSRKTTGIS